MNEMDTPNGIEPSQREKELLYNLLNIIQGYTIDEIILALSSISGCTAYHYFNDECASDPTQMRKATIELRRKWITYITASLHQALKSALSEI